MAERGKLNTVLAVIAVAILVGSGVALALANAPHGNSDVIIVNGKEYAWERLETDFQTVQFEANGIQYTGIRISDVMNDTGLTNPELYSYTIKSARDGYTKSKLAWNDLLNGFLVKEYDKRAVLTTHPQKSFWVDTVGEINPVGV